MANWRVSLNAFPAFALAVNQTLAISLLLPASMHAHARKFFRLQQATSKRISLECSGLIIIASGIPTPASGFQFVGEWRGDLPRQGEGR
jgi:hypothetical protein